MKAFAPILTFILSALLLTSCVSKKKYDETVAAAAAERAALEKQMADVRAEKEQLQGEMARLESNLNMSKQEIQQLSERVRNNNEKIERLRNAIADVFNDWDEEDINIEERSGKLYITLANDILYQSGSARLSRDSREVIARLADVFNDNGDLAIAVEGHTDNEPVRIHRQKFQDNWALSVARATEVVRALTAAGVDAGRLIATGKGDTQPIADNSTDEGRRENRRTEFVIMPDIDGLYRMYKEEMSDTK